MAAADQGKKKRRSTPRSTATSESTRMSRARTGCRADLAAADGYLGNGYPTWCLDVVRRQLAERHATPVRFRGDPHRLAPIQNFSRLNAVARVLQCDDNGDGRSDRGHGPVPSSTCWGSSRPGRRYWVLPDQHIGGHTVTGFASGMSGRSRGHLFASRGRHAGAPNDNFALTFLGGLGGDRACGSRYRFDKATTPISAQPHARPAGERVRPPVLSMRRSAASDSDPAAS